MSGMRFLAIFLIVGWLSITPFLLAFDSYVLIGASCGICGVFGAIMPRLRHYGLPVLKILSISILALALSSIIEAIYFKSAETTIQFFAHVVALLLGVGLSVWWERAFPSRSRRFTRIRPRKGNRSQRYRFLRTVGRG